MLRNVRYIPLSADQAIIAFNPVSGFNTVSGVAASTESNTLSGAAQISDTSQEVRLALIPSGADREPRKVRLLPIVEAARLLGDVEEPLPVADGQVIFTFNSDDRVAIRVTAHSDAHCDLDRQAFRLIPSG